MPDPHTSEVEQGNRFEFGDNWAQFLELIDDDRLQAAEESLRLMLGIDDLRGKRFLDIGSGSGLFSLAARRLGARVHSFDFDPQSVACTAELKRRLFPQDRDWVVERGSVLDQDYLARLGEFDFVYSWGVLHHTGDMWEALQNAAQMVTDGGLLCIAIYNDQGWASKAWLRLKRAYNRLPRKLRWLVLGPAFVRLWGPTTFRDFVRGQPFRTWRAYGKQSMRGMSPWRDVVDWVGGLPFEVAKPEGVFEFIRQRGFSLLRMKTCGGGHGCNEFVFVNRENS
jgi:2-polyprenyl-6-hydroxyphenyl methylase/3-demethylubiquinone-9 3-methyltransferase